MAKADWRHMKRRFHYAPAARVPVSGNARLTFLNKGRVSPVPADSQPGDVWHTHRGWPVFGKASWVTILTAKHEDGSGTLSVFRRPSRGFARHLRNTQ